MACKRGRRQKGFSLLEVIVAFAILTISLGVLIQIFSRALGTTALSGEYSRAASLAQERLDSVGVDIPLEPGSYGPETKDGFYWQVTIEPFVPEDVSWEPAVDAFLVTSMISWGAGRSEPRQIILSSLRLAESSESAGLFPDVGLGLGNRRQDSDAR
jgi:general secretion pathway protein I